MSHLFVPEIPILEKIVRSALVYLFMLLAFRILGKRQVAQMTPFDLVLLLIISNVVQNALIGKDDSLTGGLVGAVTIFLLNFGVAEIAFRSKRVRRVLEPQPTLLIHRGKILEKNLSRELMTEEELMAALRENGIDDPTKVHAAVLEENGRVSVIPEPYVK